MPKTARHKRRRKAFKLKFNPKFFLFSFFLFLFAFIFISFKSGVWDGKSKVVIAVFQDKAGKIIVADPQSGEVVNIDISGETEVVLARNFGTIRLKNVWEFGKNEKDAGDIFVKTLSKNFFAPVYLYSVEDPKNFTRFVYKNSDTNIKFIDRVKIALFIKRIGNSSQIDINLAKNAFLKKEKLSDGEIGYKIYENLLKRLYFYFDDQYISENDIKVYIIDATGRYSVADGVGKTVEAMGAKVVAINRVAGEKTGCLISGKNQKAVKIISSLYSCNPSKELGGGSDVIIKLGQEFANKY